MEDYVVVEDEILYVEDDVPDVEVLNVLDVEDEVEDNVFDLEDAVLDPEDDVLDIEDEVYDLDD